MGLPNEVISGLLSSAKDEDTYQVSRSLRFNRPDIAYLLRNPSSSGNRTTWTFSCWLKRSRLDSSTNVYTIFGSFDGSSTLDYLSFYQDTLYFYFASSILVQTTQIFRDPSAWYHIVCVVDTTQAQTSSTASDSRLRFYVNGTQITSFSTISMPAQNTQSSRWNVSGVDNIIGGYRAGLGAQYFDGYMTEINFIDGQALTPSSFGQSDTNGRWVPKAYTGTYGTNGFYLKFADNSGTTATTLGKDSSGNGNNWTPTNFSVTAGTGNDSFVDSPTNYGTDTRLGGEVRGNYATLNPIFVNGSSGQSVNGNLDHYMPVNNLGNVSSVRIPNTGKWYAEFTCLTAFSGGIEVYCGVNTETVALNASRGGNSTAYCYYNGSGQKVIDGTFSAYGASYTTNDVIGIAVNKDTATLTFYKNGVSQGAITSLPTTKVYFWSGSGGGSLYTAGSWNFGQRPFANTAPTGFKALCTTNLPTPTIKKPSQYMNIVTYTGNGITRSITGVGFQPNLVWTEAVGTSTEDGLIVDSTRGATKRLMPCFTYTEVTESGITSFDTDGFTINGTTDTGYNTNAVNYVGWCWKLGATPGFDIATYRGTGASRTISHNLGVAPRVMIVKSRTNSTDWTMYHADLGAGGAIFLNSTGAYAASSTYWDSTAPTSTVFSLGNANATNQSPQDYVNYLWAEVDGFSRFRSYTGNASADGPFVWCGFRPKWIMIKLNGTGNWWIYDTSRSTFNPAINKIINTITTAEDTAGEDIDILSNGFKLKTTAATLNGSSATHIFMAFAETPFKYSRGR